jgi:hypothetical protein
MLVAAITAKAYSQFGQPDGADGGKSAGVGQTRYPTQRVVKFECKSNLDIFLPKL